MILFEEETWPLLSAIATGLPELALVERLGLKGRERIHRACSSAPAAGSGEDRRGRSASVPCEGTLYPSHLIKAGHRPWTLKQPTHEKPLKTFVDIVSWIEIGC